LRTKSAAAPRTELWETIAILGTGLIGASIGLALKRKDKRVRIVGWDAKRAASAAAKRRRAVDEIAPSLCEAIGSADIIVLAAPHAAILKLMPATFGSAPHKSLIIDVAGLKTKISARASRLLAAHRGAAFVAGHPMAGLERAGPSNAKADLFVGRPFAIHAPPQPGRNAVTIRARKFVRRLGALPVEVEPELHDRIVAATSALPQLAAVAMASAVDRRAGGAASSLAGPALESSLRLAASPFASWETGLLENSGHLVPALRELERRLRQLTKAIERGDRRLLARSFASAAEASRRVLRFRKRNTR